MRLVLRKIGENQGSLRQIAERYKDWAEARTERKRQRQLQTAHQMGEQIAKEKERLKKLNLLLAKPCSERMGETMVDAPRKEKLLAFMDILGKELLIINYVAGFTMLAALDNIQMPGKKALAGGMLAGLNIIWVGKAIQRVRGAPSDYLTVLRDTVFEGIKALENRYAELATDLLNNR